MNVKSATHTYVVGGQVAETDTYRLYLCTQEGSGRQCLLQIAADAGNNGALDRAAFILGELERRAHQLEEEYAAVKAGPNVFLNYDLGFPELVDSFVLTEQGGRRINILAFRSVENVSQMVPLSNIIEKDGLRVDLRTSAWIMGKSLKLLAFAHSVGITVGRLDTANILIEPKEHYVVFFDWSNAQTTNTIMIPPQWGQADIAQAAQAVVALVGGDYETGAFPNDASEEYKGYRDNLLDLARGGQHNAQRAHGQFYQLVDALWERAFYPFTTHRK